MNRRPAVLSITVAGLLSAAIFAGCSDSDDTSGATGSGATGSQPATEVDAPAGTSGPASAGDKVPDAPDNAISDRPGGPNDTNGKDDKGGKDADHEQQEGSGSAEPY
ncbi:MAG: hypothetical protein KDB62_00315 [Solirubrobacterales bacterium]|nr:hypothetical protein [Solirubrobacterales bacterium]